MQKYYNIYYYYYYILTFLSPLTSEMIAIPLPCNITEYKNVAMPCYLYLGIKYFVAPSEFYSVENGPKWLFWRWRSQTWSSITLVMWPPLPSNFCGRATWLAAALISCSGLFLAHSSTLLHSAADITSISSCDTTGDWQTHSVSGEHYDYAF